MLDNITVLEQTVTLFSFPLDKSFTSQDCSFAKGKTERVLLKTEICFDPGDHVFFIQKMADSFFAISVV